MRLLLSLLPPLLLLLAGAEARLKGHDGIFECYTTGSCQLCTHDEMQDVGTACKATGHHQAIECLITGPTLEDVNAALLEVNTRRVKEPRFTATPSPGVDGDAGLSPRRALLDQGELVIREEGQGDDDGAGGHRAGRRRTVRTAQRCDVLAHEATGRALLRFEAASLLCAGASLGFVWHRKRAAQLRRGGGL